MTKAVVFDMDGVLIDSMETHYAAWAKVFDEIGVAIHREDFASTPGKTAAPVIRVLGRRDFTDGEIRDIAGKQETQVLRILQEDDPFPAMPGAEDLVRRLDAAGWLMAVGTSGPKAQVDLVMKKLGNGDSFKIGVSAGDVKNGKPDPEVFLKAADRLGVPPSRTVVIEDSVAGLEAARSGGFKTVALTSTFPAETLAPLADLVVDSLSLITTRELDRLIEAG